MANEVTITTSISASKGGASINSVGSTGAAAVQFDMPTGSDHMGTTPQVIAQAADEALAIPADISPVGALLLKNLDATNYIELSLGTGGAFAASVFTRVPAGATVVLYPQSLTYYAKANTADVAVTFSAVETIE